MARPVSMEYPGAVCHVMNRGLAGQKIFQDVVFDTVGIFATRPTVFAIGRVLGRFGIGLSSWFLQPPTHQANKARA